MFIKKVKNKQGRINIAISQSYRDANGKSKSRVIKGLGYLDLIEQEHKDPWAFIHAEMQRIQDEYEASRVVTQLPIALYEKLDDQDPLLIKNYGYAVFSKLYHDLEIDYFINNRRRYTDCSYNHNAILKMLVYSRLLNPSSKKLSWEKRHQFFDTMDFSLSHVYRSLEFFADHEQTLFPALDARIKRLYGRDTSVFYYDVTNFYFEIDQEDEIRKRGVSKEHRPLPIIQMGLFMDAQGIPVSYKLFEGNTQDSQTFAPAMRELQASQEKGPRYVVVADNGMFSGDNIRQVMINGNGFIVAYSLKKGTKSIRQFAFDPDDYWFYDTSFDAKTRKPTKRLKRWDQNHEQASEVIRFKEMITPFEIKVSSIDGKKRSVKLDEVKVVVTYSPAYAEKAAKDRERVVEKTQKIIEKGRLFGSQDARKLIKISSFSKEHGEQVDTEEFFELDTEKLAYEAQFDGYHALMTSEVDMPPGQVVQQYHGLWEIEESFRITKSELKSRPVYVSTQKHIQAHFLTCFLALTILRLLEKQMNDLYSSKEILQNLRECKAYYLGDNIYRFYHTSPCLQDIGKAMGIDFSKKFMTKQEIVSQMALTKRSDE